VLDLRSIRPIDIDLIVDSVRRRIAWCGGRGLEVLRTRAGLVRSSTSMPLIPFDAPIQHIAGADVARCLFEPLERGSHEKRILSTRHGPLCPPRSFVAR